MFHVERGDQKCCGAQARRQCSASDHYLRPGLLDHIHERLLMSGVQLGSQIIQTQQRPMTAHVRVELRLGEQARQRNQFFLAT